MSYPTHIPLIYPAIQCLNSYRVALRFGETIFFSSNVLKEGLVTLDVCSVERSLAGKCMTMLRPIKVPMKTNNNPTSPLVLLNLPCIVQTNEQQPFAIGAISVGVPSTSVDILVAPLQALAQAFAQPLLVDAIPSVQQLASHIFNGAHPPAEQQQQQGAAVNHQSLVPDDTLDMFRAMSLDCANLFDDAANEMLQQMTNSGDGSGSNVTGGSVHLELQSSLTPRRLSGLLAASNSAFSTKPNVM